MSVYASYKPSNTKLMGILDTTMYILRMTTVGNVANTCIFSLTQPYCSVVHREEGKSHTTSKPLFFKG